MRNCKSQNIIPLRNIERFKGIGEKEEFKGTQECKIKYFAFCYNNSCPIHKEVKYGVSYWLQELSLEQFKGIKEKDEQDRLQYGTNIYRNNVIEDLKTLVVQGLYSTGITLQQPERQCK